MRLAFNIHAMMLEEKLRPQHTHAKRGKKERNSERNNHIYWNQSKWTKRQLRLFFICTIKYGRSECFIGDRKHSMRFRFSLLCLVCLLYLVHIIAMNNVIILMYSVCSGW